MERWRKHINLQKKVFLFVFISIGLSNLLYNLFSNLSFNDIITNFIYFLLAYLILALLLYLNHLGFISGNTMILKFYYYKYIPVASKIKTNRSNSLIYRLLDRISIFEHIDLIEQSKALLEQDSNYQKWVFNASNSKKPVFIRREHLDKNYFLENWAFSNVVLLNNKIKILRVKDNKFQLEVDLTNESYGIYNNAGKAFLKETFHSDTFEAECHKKGLEIQRFLNGVDNKNLIEIDPKQFPLRWASGGILPIVKYKDKLWFMLVFRGIYPIGWNLANGGSENKEEYKKINTLMLREFFEEFIICSRQPQNNDKRITSIRRFDPGNGIIDDLSDELQKEIRSHHFQEKHFRLRKDHDKINFKTNNEESIRLDKIDGAFTLKIKHHNKKSNLEVKTVRDVMISFDFLQFGVECNSVYFFEMKDDDYPLFGEIWDVADCLIREPIMFLSLDFLKDQFKKNGSVGELKEDADGCKVINGITPNDFILFDKDIELKIERLNNLRKLKNKSPKELKEIEFHQKWVDIYLQTFTNVQNNKESINKIDNEIVRTLCPVTWKLIEQFFSFKLDKHLKL